MNRFLQQAKKKLEKLGIEYKILDLGDKAFTVDDVERLCNVNPREICKTLIVKTDKNEIYAIMLSGKKRIDNKKLCRLVNTKKTRFLTGGELKKKTVFEPGTVCPVLVENIPVLIDKSVFKTERINFGSGDLYYGIEIKSKDILKCVDAKIVDIVE